MTEPINVLWTAGWDSTFRVADLILNRRKLVQRHYVHDWRRPSTPVEIQHQALIRKEIAQVNAEAVQRLLPTRVHNIDDIPSNAAVRAQLDRLTRKMHLGSQYDFLSRMARAAGLVDLELSVHK